MARGGEVGPGVRIERHDGDVAPLPAQAAEHRSLGIGREVDAVRRPGRVHGEPRLVLGDRHDPRVERLEAPLRVALQGIVDDADVVHRAVILGAEHDVGVATVLVLDAHGRLDPVDAVLGAGIELAQARVLPAVGTAAAAPQPLPVQLEVGVEAVEAAAVGVAPQVPGVAREVGHVLPRPVAADQGAALLRDRMVDGPGEMVGDLDHGIVEEVLRLIADEQDGAVDCHGGMTSRKSGSATPGNATPGHATHHHLATRRAVGTVCATRRRRR